MVEQEIDVTIQEQIQFFAILEDQNLKRALGDFLALKGYELREAEDLETAFQDSFPLLLIIDQRVFQEYQKRGGDLGEHRWAVISNPGERFTPHPLQRELAYFKVPFQLSQLWEWYSEEFEVGVSEVIDVEEVLCADVMDGQHHESLPVFEILYCAMKDRFTGLLTLYYGKCLRQIAMVNGFPVTLKSNVLKEHLLSQLYHQGKLDQQQYAYYLNRLQKSGRTPTHSLIRAGIMTLRDWSKAKMELAQHLLQYALTYQPERFVFKNSASCLQKVPAMPISYFQTLLKWIKQNLSLELIQAFWKNYWEKKLKLKETLYDWQPSLGKLVQVQTLVKYQTIGEYVNRERDSEYILTLLWGLGILDGILQRTHFWSFITKHQMPRPSIPTWEVGCSKDTGLYSSIYKKVTSIRHRPTQLRQRSNPSRADTGSLSKVQISKVQMDNIRQIIHKDYMRITSTDDPYIQLNVSLRDDLKKIRKKYEQYEKFYRPELLEHLDSKLYRLAVDIRKGLVQAILEIESRQAENSFRTAKESSWRSLDYSGDPLSYIFFNDAITYLKLGNLREAKIHLRWAIERNPKTLAFKAYLIWVEFLENRRNPPKIHALKVQLEEWHQKYPKDDTVCHFLAHFYREEGALDKALEFYRKAVELNPNNQSARRLLSQLES